jgi:hypothetical protein
VGRGTQGVHFGRLLPLLAGVAIACLLIAALATAEVLARGELLTYTHMTVERVRVLGGLELWVAREPFSRLDLLNGGILAAGCILALLTAARLRGLPSAGRGEPSGRPVVFFVLLGAGLAFLALDELVALHETIGYNLDFLADLPGAKSPEDVVFAMYALPALGFLLYYRDMIAASRRGLLLVALGVGLFGVAAALDVSDALLDEQWVEPPGSLLLVAGFAFVAARHVSAAGVTSATGDRVRHRSASARA